MIELNEPPVTMVLFAFNNEKYIREAVHGALIQDYAALQIIFSDDNSTDRTFEIMEEIVTAYIGPHIVRMNRNSSNMGICGHINKLVSMVDTDFLVLAAGDDISVPSRTSRLVEEWIASNSRTVLIHSGLSGIDEKSTTVDMNGEDSYRGPRSELSMARGDIGVLGATTAMTKDVFDRFPGLLPTVTYEDRVLPFRALLLGGLVIYVEDRLVKYRVTGGISRLVVRTLRDYLDVYTPMISTRTLPDAVQRLSDTLVAQPENREIRYECEATIADTECRLDMHFNRSCYYEVLVFRWLLRGARKKPLLKHYIKMRFLRVFT